MIRYNLSYPTYLGANYDASTTNLSYSIPPPSTYSKSTKPLEIVLSFLSPITPTSTLRQAIPASYLTVHVSGSFDVNVYVDVNGQWASGDRGSRVVWDLHYNDVSNNEKALKTWKVKRETEQLLTEWNDRAEWGTLHFTAPSVSASNIGSLLRLRIKRMYGMNLVPQHCSAIDSQKQVFSKMSLIVITEASWRKSQYSHLPNRSN